LQVIFSFPFFCLLVFTSFNGHFMNVICDWSYKLSLLWWNKNQTQVWHLLEEAPLVCNTIPHLLFRFPWVRKKVVRFEEILNSPNNGTWNMVWFHMDLWNWRSLKSPSHSSLPNLMWGERLQYTKVTTQFLRKAWHYNSV
jgi:hypothetical protein